MNKRVHVLSSLFILMLLWAATGPEPLRSAPKTYWHFTFVANINGAAAQEWLWATMVELPKEMVFFDEAFMAEAMGGKLEGTVFGLVRAAVWRSQYTYHLNTKCKGRRSKMEISYGESWGDSVFVHGQIIKPRGSGRAETPGLHFRWGVCNHRVLREDGRWLNLDEVPYVFVGPIRVEGGETEEMRGEFKIDGINYDDEIQRVKRCGESWVEDFKSVFRHFQIQSLVDNFHVGENDVFGQRTWRSHGLNVQCAYSVIRSSEREHPFWKQRRM